MPSKFSTFVAAAKERDSRISALPRDVREAVLAMAPDEQDQYLASLAEVERKEATGEVFTPNVAKKKPGRKAAAHPGARTKERPEPLLRAEYDGQDLEAILADPEDEEPVKFGSRTPGDPSSEPKAPTAAMPMTPDQRLYAEQQTYRAQLEAERDAQEAAE
jgi:hypothetical protein